MAIRRSPPDLSRPDGIGGVQEVQRSNTVRSLTSIADEDVEIYKCLFDQGGGNVNYAFTELSPGSTQELVHLGTGETMPYTVDAGDEWRIMENFWTFDRSATIEFFVDGNQYQKFHIGNREFHLRSPAVGFNVNFIDPNLSSSHDVRMQITNDDPNNGLSGYIGLVVIQK